MTTGAVLRACTNTLHANLIHVPGGILVRDDAEGWCGPPVSHRAPTAPQGRLVIDRWLDDTCLRTSDLRTDAGHRWAVREVHPGAAPLPRGAVITVPGMYPISAQVLQERAVATAEWAAGRRRGSQLGTALAPAWTWWLWALGRVELPVADALGVLEYATDRAPALAA